MDLSWSVLDTQALEEAKVDLGQSLMTFPEVPQKRQSLLSDLEESDFCSDLFLEFPEVQVS